MLFCFVGELGCVLEFESLLRFDLVLIKSKDFLSAPATGILKRPLESVFELVFVEPELNRKRFLSLDWTAGVLVMVSLALELELSALEEVEKSVLDELLVWDREEVLSW